MTNEQMHTTQETAHMLGVTPTTVRRYTKDFGQHLSEFTQRKRRQFTDRDISTLKTAQRLGGEGHTKTEINQLLFTVDTTPDTGKALANYGEVITEIDNIKSTIKTALEETVTLARDTAENQKATAQRVNTWLLLLSLAVGILFVLVLVLVILLITRP